ncbi:MAG: CRISPR-associated protein Csx16 [Gammaproteobacteria bacterium]
MTTWFITRRFRARDWARLQGRRIDRFVNHIDTTEIESGDIVICSLPVHLATEVCARGARHFHLTIDLPPKSFGCELNA